MPTSTRFAVAVHILTGMARHGDEPLTSGEIAKSAHTNPAVIRRLISILSRAGLCRSQLGQGGGSVLSRNPEEIALLDVYNLVENSELFALHREQPDQDCVVGKHIQTALRSHLEAARRAMENELAHVTIADLVTDIHRLQHQR